MRYMTHMHTSYIYQGTYTYLLLIYTIFITELIELQNYIITIRVSAFYKRSAVP